MILPLPIQLQKRVMGGGSGGGDRPDPPVAYASQRKSENKELKP